MFPARQHPVHLITAAAAVAAVSLAAARPAQAAVTGLLYEGLGYSIVEIAPGSLAPVGYVNPNLAYTLPGSSTGGATAGLGMGLGSAQLSIGTAFLGQRGLVVTAAGSYALGTLGVNSVAGWLPQGFASSSAQATNASGVIVGTSTLYTADGTRELGGRAVFYAPGSSTPTQLQMPAGFTDSTGYGIAYASNIASSGVVIGAATQFSGDVSLGTRALRWRSTSATAEVLGKLPGTSEWGDSTSAAVSVNKAGAVVGWGNTFNARGKLRGFSAVRWDADSTRATALDSLGSAADGTYQSSAAAINDAGIAVGSSAKYSSTHQAQGEGAVRWAAGSTAAQELHGLQGNLQGETFTNAIGLNNAGTVFGISRKFDGMGTDLGQRAVTWGADSTAAVELELLSEGAGGASFSYAFDINEAGYVAGFANIVGTTSNAASDPRALDVHAVVWTPDGQVIDLNTLLPQNSGWTLYSANAISDSGWVTGLGFYQPEGYSSDFAYARLYGMQLSAVPEPASALLLGLGAAALLLRRRRGL